MANARSILICNLPKLFPPPTTSADNFVVFTVDGKTAFEIPTSEIMQTDKDQRKTEVSLMFAAPPGHVC